MGQAAGRTADASPAGGLASPVSATHRGCATQGADGAARRTRLSRSSRPAEAAAEAAIGGGSPCRLSFLLVSHGGAWLVRKSRRAL